DSPSADASERGASTAPVPASSSLSEGQAPGQATVEDVRAGCAPGSGVAGGGVGLEVVVRGLVAPTYVAHSGDGTGRLFVAEQAGRIRVLDPGGSALAPWLDISDRVEVGGEAGLVGLAFHPDYKDNGRLFVYYTKDAASVVLSEFRVLGDPLADLPALTSERKLLEVEQRFSNHYGGQLLFDATGHLFVGIGDGGSEGDPDNNAQRLDSLMGKILRLNVDGAEPYEVPPDNPFVGQDQARGEIWALGLRNPYRFSLDRVTGEMWIADVGSRAREEIDLGRAGANYGWKQVEGSQCFVENCDPSKFTAPVWEYANPQDGLSVIGGYVYRGCTLRDLWGQYVFSDYGERHSPLWSLRRQGDAVTRGSVAIADAGALIASFGEGPDGELYAVDHGGGRLLKLQPSSAAASPDR
ncbi:MAG TPA: glucose dehydrogenase, partial [Deltaproteobacteria bacterium]|nr:glucose dehydrogenase [Deltaproteobacteria bacterium]